MLAINSTTTGIFVKGLGNGFQFSVPADTKFTRLKIYLGLFAAQGHFEAGLNDFSAPPFTDDSLMSAFGNSYGVYTLDFAAATPGKALNIKYTSAQLFDPDFGNVTWQAATLHLPLLTLSNPQKSGNQFSFIVSSEFNAIHDVEYAPSLSGPWLNLTNFPGVTTDVLITDAAATASTRFYRVRLE